MTQRDADESRWKTIATSADDSGLLTTLMHLSISTREYPELIADPSIDDPDRTMTR